MRNAPPDVLMLSAAHPAEDIRIVRKEGASLAAAGWRVRHLAPDRPARAALPGAKPAAAKLAGVEIETYPRGAGMLGRLRGLPRLLARAASSGAAVLHAHEPDSWFVALLAARWSGARVVIDVHEHYPSRLDTRLQPPLRPFARAAIRAACRLAGACADAVVVARDGLGADFAAAGDRVIAVRNHVLDQPVTPRCHQAGPVTLVHAGILGVTRGALLLPEALALCPPGTRLRLIGRFTEGSEAPFAARIAALGLQDRIEDLGWLAQEDLPAAIAGGDIGLVTFQPVDLNHRLALPHKLFDYMLAGLPVIVPDFAAEAVSVVREAGCGLAVDTSDPRAVADAVMTLADPALRAAMGARGREAARGRHGWAAEAERLVALYRRLLPSARIQTTTAAAPASGVPSARAPR